MPSLRELQRRFLAAVAAGGMQSGDGSPAASADPGVLEMLRDHGGLGGAERLEIYAGMYRARLLDVLRADFPRTAALLGEESFATLAGRYLVRWPSTTPSVRHVGRRFAGFLAAEAAVPAFVGDLARLEWARVEVFDAADAEPLRLDELRSLPAAAWPALRLRPVPACAVVESAWPVHRMWTEAETSPGGVMPTPAREATTIRVWRDGWNVSHAAMAPAERRAFRALRRG